MANEVAVIIRFSSTGSQQVISQISQIAEKHGGVVKVNKEAAQGWDWNKREVMQMTNAMRSASFVMGDLGAGQRALVGITGELNQRLIEAKMAGGNFTASLKGMLGGMLASGAIMGASIALEEWGRRAREALANAEAVEKGLAGLVMTKAKERQDRELAQLKRGYDDKKVSYTDYSNWLQNQAYADGKKLADVEAKIRGTRDAKEQADLLRQREALATHRDQMIQQAYAAFDQLQDEFEREHQAILASERRAAEDLYAARLKDNEARAAMERTAARERRAIEYQMAQPIKQDELTDYDERLAARQAFLDKYVRTGAQAYRADLANLKLWQRSGIISETEYQKSLTRVKVTHALATAATITSQGAATFKALAAMNRQYIDAYKAFAVADVTIKSVQAIWQGYATLGPILGSVMAGLIAAKAYADIATITSTSDAGGTFPSQNTTVPNVGATYPTASPLPDRGGSQTVQNIYIYGSLWGTKDLARALGPAIRQASADNVDFGFVRK